LIPAYVGAARKCIEKQPLESCLAVRLLIGRASALFKKRK